ncbi:MAG: apolipoprotein N-acyltransferase, partial [Candidatus Omnitrophota bacterium]
MDQNNTKSFLTGIIPAGIVFLALGVFLAHTFMRTSALTEQAESLAARLEYLAAESASTTAALSRDISRFSQNLADLRSETIGISDTLSGAQKNIDAVKTQVGGVEQTMGSISGTVGTLQKLSQIDPELLKKYSKFYFLNENRYTPMLLETIRGIGTDFIIGSPAFERKGTEESYRNRAYLLTANGAAAGHYDKARLVPFGEFVPFKQWLPFIGKIVAEVGDFEAGPEGETLLWGNYRIGMQICYEMIFPHLSRKAVLNGADCIVNITNDAWYGTSSAPYQLFSMAIVRAVENRRTVIRAANTGISGFVDAGGRIMGNTDLF